MNSNTPSEQRWVPVVSSTGQPLMPCCPARARVLVKRGKAVKHFYKGLFYIKLLHRATGDTQLTVVGVDPGSKREAFTVKSYKRTFLNLQSHAVDGKRIKSTIEGRKNARRARRQRTTPCRANRQNRSHNLNWVPPSTKARWQAKYNIINSLAKLYPITVVVIEDVKAVTKEGMKLWNNSFSPIQVGKNWLYNKLKSDGYTLSLFSGMDTYTLRQELKLHKSKNKLASIFSAHCVDSWVLANKVVGGHSSPDLTHLIELKPLVYSRRQLHRFNPSKGNTRARYGGTISLGMKRGTLAHHPKYGRCLVGGNNGIDRVSLHSPISAYRLTQTAKLEEVTPIAYSTWLLIDSTTFNKAEKKVIRFNRHLQRNIYAHSNQF